MKRFNPSIAVPLLAVVIVAAVLCIFTSPFEVVKPEIRPDTAIGPIGKQKTLVIHFTDNRSGLSHVDMALVQDDKSHTLASLDFPEKGTLEKTVSVNIYPADLKLHDGEATVTVTASDHSLFRNTARLVEKVAIDTVPPQLSILSTAHNVQAGGSGLAVFRVSKEVEKSGVQIGSDFFTGYPVVLGGKTTFLSYFPVPLSSEKGSLKMAVHVRDRGGNEVVSALPSHLKPKRFRRDNLDLSEQFLTQKM